MKPVHILKISEFTHEGSEDIHANTLENHLATRHKDIAEPHSHNFYLAILFIKGHGRHEIDFTDYEVKPGALFFLNPGQTHYWELSADTEGYIFFHTRDFFEAWFTANELRSFPFFYSMHSKPVVYLNQEALTEATHYFKKILEEFTTEKAWKKNAMLCYINLMYVQATRWFDEDILPIAENNNGYYQRFRQFEDLIETHFVTEKSPGFYADKLAITLRHLNRISQNITGKPAGDIIAGRIVLEAQKELALHRGNFKKIAEMLGYEDYAYFSRFFKNNTGETPSAFAKRYTNK